VKVIAHTQTIHSYISNVIQLREVNKVWSELNHGLELDRLDSEALDDHSFNVLPQYHPTSTPV